MLGKQAKVLSDGQAKAVLNYLATTRHPERNIAIFMLSLKAGLRAKEISQLTWSMVLESDGSISNVINLTDSASKGKSGAIIPMSSHISLALSELLRCEPPDTFLCRIVKTSRAKQTSAQVIVNMFRQWYSELGFMGCSSHSGRRTFITKSARNIGRFGGSMRDVQALARHQSLAMTQRYIEVDTEAMQKVVEI